MNRAQELRFYIEALCVYDLKKDDVIASLLKLLQSVGNESVLENQSEFFRKVTRKKSFKEYVSKLILIDDNAFTKAAASGKIEELPQAVINGVKSDLQKLEAISNITSADIYESVESESLRGVLKTLPQWETGAPLLRRTQIFLYTQLSMPVIACSTSYCCSFRPFFMESPSVISISTICPACAQITRLVLPSASTLTA